MFELVALNCYNNKRLLTSSGKKLLLAIIFQEDEEQSESDEEDEKKLSPSVLASLSPIYVRISVYVPIPLLYWICKERGNQDQEDKLIRNKALATVHGENDEPQGELRRVQES